MKFFIYFMCFSPKYFLYNLKLPRNVIYELDMIVPF